MTSKERVLTAFEQREPDRVPCWMGASPEFRDLARAYLNLRSDEDLSLHIGDDFETQAGPVVGEKLFRRFLLPHLKRLIASPSHDYLLPETPVENVLAFYEAVRDFGGY